MESINDLQDIKDTLNAWLKAFNEKDINTLFSLYDLDSIFSNAEVPLIKDVDQIKAWYKVAFEQAEGILLYKEEGAFFEGNIAFLVGAYYFQPLEDIASTEKSNSSGRASLVFRRNGEGMWKLVFDMDNTLPNVIPTDFIPTC